MVCSLQCRDDLEGNQRRGLIEDKMMWHEPLGEAAGIDSETTY
jgi:hypothetical protein